MFTRIAYYLAFSVEHKNDQVFEKEPVDFEILFPSPNRVQKFNSENANIVTERIETVSKL